MENAEKNFIDNVMNIFNETETNVVNETETTTNAMTLGLGFHDFRGKNATTKELQTVFDKIRDWFIEIYKSAKDIAFEKERNKYRKQIKHFTVHIKYQI